MKWGGSASGARRRRRLRRWTRQDLLAATHECGHLVAAIRQGVRAHWATIDGNESWNGRTCFSRSRKLSPKGVKAHVILLLAGEAAEAKLTGRSAREGSRSDRSEALELARTLFDGAGEAEKYVEDLEAAAKRLVATPRWWGPIVRMSQELVEKRALSGAAGRRIVWEYDRSQPSNRTKG